MGYSDKVLDHYNNPRNVGSFAKDEADVGTGVVGAPECGDVMKLQLKINPEGVIEDARFKTFGCGSAIASSSYVTELVKGKRIEEAMVSRTVRSSRSSICRRSRSTARCWPRTRSRRRLLTGSTSTRARRRRREVRRRWVQVTKRSEGRGGGRE